MDFLPSKGSFGWFQDVRRSWKTSPRDRHVEPINMTSELFDDDEDKVEDDEGRTKLVDIDAKIRTLQRIKDTLVSLVAACDGCAPVSTCPILDAHETQENETELCKYIRKK